MHRRRNLEEQTHGNLCRGVDGKNACGISNAIAHLGEGAEDDSACGGKLVQMVHDLDLVTADREDVLFAGVGAGILTRGCARLLSLGFLLMLKRCRDSSISAALRYILDCDSTMFRLRDHCVSPCRALMAKGGSVQYRVDPKSGNRISALGLGCMRFPGAPGRPDAKTADAIISRAVEQGINYLDTAYLYPGNEVCVGASLERLGLRDRVLLATKLPHASCACTGDFDRFFDEQLRRLRTDHIDYYLMHNITSPAQWERVVALGIEDWIARQKAAGRIRQIGFSYHGSAADFLTMLDAYDWDFCQIQFNYMDEHSQAGLRGLQYAAGKGLPVIIMEPLRGGRLVQGLPESAKRVFEKTTPKRSPAEWGLRWVWNHPEVTVILSGMNEIEQVEENVRIASEAKADSLSKEELDVFEQVKQEINKKIKVPCTGCAYCMPCPQGVDIPGCFSAYNMRYTDGWYAGFKTYFMCTTLRKNQTNASKCVGCGKCEQHCPQSIPIRQKLKEVRQHMEGPVYHVGRFVAKHTRKD